MKKYENKTYQELKTIASSNGLSGAGNREAVINRLIEFDNGNIAHKEYVSESDNNDISPDEVIINPRQEETTQILANNELEEKRIAHETKIESLKRKLDIVFAGRVQVVVRENSPGNYSIVFKGLARKSWTINLSAGEKFIINEAYKYIGRAAVSSDATAEYTMEKAIQNFGGMNG